MGLEQVADDVKEEARKKAEEIKKEARKEKQEKIEQAEKQAEEIIEETKQEIEKEIQQMKETKKSGARLDARRIKSQTRKELLEEVRKEAKQEIGNLENQRKELTRDLLEDALEQIKDKEVKIYSADKDEDLINEILDDIEIDGEYSGSENILGGVIIESKDGKIRIDNSFDSLLEEIWENELKSISSKLFNE